MRSVGERRVNHGVSLRAGSYFGLDFGQSQETRGGYTMKAVGQPTRAVFGKRDDGRKLVSVGQRFDVGAYRVLIQPALRELDLWIDGKPGDRYLHRYFLTACRAACLQASTLLRSE